MDPSWSRVHGSCWEEVGDSAQGKMASRWDALRKACAQLMPQLTFERSKGSHQRAGATGGWALSNTGKVVHVSLNSSLDKRNVRGTTVCVPFSPGRIARTVTHFLPAGSVDSWSGWVQVSLSPCSRVGRIWFCNCQLCYFPVAQTVKNYTVMQETWVRSLGREDPLEEEMATHSRN